MEALVSSDTKSNIRIAKNSLYMTIRMLAVLCITFYSTRVILNSLGVVDYGVYNVVAGFVSLFSFLGTSMSNAIQRFYNYEFARNGIRGAQNVFNTSVIIQIFLAVVLISLLELTGPWYIQNKMVITESTQDNAQYLFQFSVLSFVCVILQSPFLAAVMAHERMGFYSIVSVIDAGLKLLIAFLLSYFTKQPLLIYGLFLFIEHLLILFLYIIYTVKIFEEIKFTFSFDKSLMKAMLSFSGWNVFGTFSGVMKDQGVNMIMNLFFGPVVNAAKGVASQINNGIQSFVSNIIIPARPHLVQSYSLGNIDRVMQLTYTVSKYSTFILYMIALPLISEIDYILKLWLGTNIPEYSATFVRIVIFIAFINNLNGSISGVVHASGKMKSYQILGAVVNILAVPIVYVSLRLGGTPYLAMILVGCVTFLNQIVCMIVLKSIVPYSIKDYLSSVICPFCLVVITTIWIPYVIMFCMNPSFGRLCTILFSCIVAISISAYFLGISSRERENLKKLISKYI